LEKIPLRFPSIGKIPVAPSKGWKKIGARVQALEKSGGFLPVVGRFSACGSRRWKNSTHFFQTLELGRAEAA